MPELPSIRMRDDPIDKDSAHRSPGRYPVRLLHGGDDSCSMATLRVRVGDDDDDRARGARAAQQGAACAITAPEAPVTPTTIVLCSAGIIGMCGNFKSRQPFAAKSRNAV